MPELKRYKLMIPGPVELAPEVLTEMAQPLVPHYGEDWTAYYDETLELLRKVFCTKGDVFIIPGSGSAGLDAALGSTISPSGRILVLSNGFFGERLAEIARSYTPNVEVLSAPLGHPINQTEVAKKLSETKFDVVAVVHCETSTGMLNPVKEIAEVCHLCNTLLIVDAISSLGIEPLYMDEWGIGICVSASQKGLESPPGLALVAVKKEAWQWIDRTARSGWYLNLQVWRKYAEQWADWHPHPVTQAVNNVRALRIAVERILGEGLDARFHRHKEAAVLLRKGLRELKFELFVPDEFASHGVTSVIAPGGKADQLLVLLRNRSGLLLAGGLGELKGKVFRIGHMGPAAREEVIRYALCALSAAVKSSVPLDR